MRLGTGMSLTNLNCRGGGPAGIPEADISTIKLLLHLDSDLTDSSIYNKAPVPKGAASIGTAEKVFGEGSLTTANNQAVSFPKSTDWNMADGIPFQMSFRVFSKTGRRSVLEALMSNVDWGAGWGLFSDNSWTTLKIASNLGFRATWSYVFPLNVWTSHRFNYDGAGNYRWYVDGVLLGVRTPSGIVDGSGPLYVGGRSSLSDNLTGHMDEVKIEKRADLVITTGATYEVESAPFVDPKITTLPPVNPPSMTKLLLHLDSNFSDSSLENNLPTLTGSLSRVPIDRVTYPASSDWFIRDGIPWQASFRLFSKTGRAGTQETFIANAGWQSGFMLRSETNWTELQIASNGFNGSNPKWPYVFPLNEWTVHRVNYDGVGNYRWYVDGILIGIRTASGFADAVKPLIIGRRPDHTDGFTGNMDEIRWEKDENLIVTTTEFYVVEAVAFPNA